MSGTGRTSSRLVSDGLRPAAPREEAGSPLRGEPSGHSRFAEVQRARLLSAMVMEVAERGAANVSVAHVVARAGVSRRTFYELFADREDCLLAAFEDALARATRYVEEVDDPDARWVERVRTALTAILAFLDAQRGAGQLLILGSSAAGAVVDKRRQRVLAQITSVIDEGRKQTKTGQELPPLTAEGIVGGVISILQARITQTPDANLTALTGPLMATIVLPYLGAAAARKEVQRPSPKRTITPTASPLQDDPLQGLEMRLTYRTIRVLTAVALEPDSSNRHIGQVAEIGDQGQVSKLLARLQRLDLIHNNGHGAATRGEPNAWQLTTRGKQVHETIVALEG